LTVTVETPDGVVSGSSVVRVVWSDSPDLFGDAPHWHSKVRGEAAVVDLGEGKYFFALLRGAERLALRVFGRNPLPVDTDGLAPFIRSVASGADGDAKAVPRNAYPLLVMFENLSDPKTAVRIDPDDLATGLGPGYALSSITLEITNEPIMAGDVAKVLKWWSSLKIPLGGENRSRYGDPLYALGKWDFVKE